MDKDTPHPDYDTLLRLYGQSMLRVAHLEMQVAHLTSQPQSRDSHQAAGDEAALAQQSIGLAELAEKVDALQKQIMDSGDRHHDPGSEPLASQEGAERGRRSDEINQMRLQITSLANQLAEAQDELHEIQGQRRRRSRKERTRPWWKTLDRRLGIRQSRS